MSTFCKKTIITILIIVIIFIVTYSSEKYNNYYDNDQVNIMSKSNIFNKILPESHIKYERKQFYQNDYINLYHVHGKKVSNDDLNRRRRKKIINKREARGGSGRAGGGRAGGSKSGGIRSGAAGGGVSPAHRGYRPNSGNILISMNSLTIISIVLNVTLILLVQGLNRRVVL